jgi:hypothetical protein
MYAAMRDALLVDGVERLTGHTLECVAAHPDRPEQVLVGTFDDGLQRSVDGGETFARVPRLTESVMSLAFDPNDPDVAYVGTEPSRVYRTANGGASWRELAPLTDLPSAENWYFPPRPDTHHVRWLEVAPDDPDRLYVGIEAGAFVLSTDGGETWRERPPGSRIDNHSLTTHPDAPERVYAAAGDGYAESHDYGASWTHPQEGLDHRYCWSIAVDPGDPDLRVMSSATGPMRAHSLPGESFVYRKVGDDPWEVAMHGLPDSEGLLRAVLDTGGPGEFYALTNLGVFYSGDAGRSWELEHELPERFHEQAPRGLVVVE